MSDINPTVAKVTERIVERSRKGRARYLDLMAREAERGPDRGSLSCSNLAHGFAAAEQDQAAIMASRGPNIGIVTAYNDMLSAHQPYGRYPDQMKIWAREAGATAQVAGGVPAMCDGVTQGQDGMELSLFSRDVIALSTAVALSHAMFDGMALLGICDKIVPGLLIGALRFGHLPAVFVPSGPMPSGIANKEKQKVRQLYAEGKATRAELLASESASYHSPGTCTFYGTANSNQMMMELMGLHVPGAAFVPPGSKLRQALTRAAVHRLAELSADEDITLARCVDEKAIVNAAVGLLATGGSTNHAIHIPAMARAAGIVIDWDDISELSGVVPLIARVYPNGAGDVNQFHAAGGMGYVIRELLGAGLAHPDIATIWGDGLGTYGQEPWLDGDTLAWRDVGESGDDTMLKPVSAPFQADGGMRLVEGNLGRACFKTSAVDPDRRTIEAPAAVFDNQHAVAEAFARGELDRDVVVVVRFQGPRANGMPELHKLTPPLGVLQDRGYRVALVTDGRMSGASGKVPAAIHCTPEALGGGPLAFLRDGDMVKLCATTGTLSTSADISDRNPAICSEDERGTGRELFGMFRQLSLPACGRGQGWAWACKAHPAATRQQAAKSHYPSRKREGLIMTEITVIDVGGTHARFARASVGPDGIELGEPVTLKTSDHVSLQLAWEAYAEKVGGALPAGAAIAIAAPIGGETIRMTNNTWTFRPDGIAGELGIEKLTLINDFGAVAHAVARALPGDLVHIAGPDKPLPDHGTVSVIGPGTGLGVAHFHRFPGGYHVQATEGAHVDFAPVDRIDDMLLADLREKHRRVSLERVVSGPGIVEIRKILGRIEKRVLADLEDRAIWQLGIDGEDTLCSAAVERFCQSLGSVCGDYALAHGSSAVVLAGGLGQRLRELLPHSGFAERFVFKGRYEHMMSGIPIRMITHPQPGLYGAAAAFASEHLT